jgi:pyruvate carboxylase
VVVEALRGTERDTGLDFEGLNELARYYEHVRKVYAANESGQVSPLAEIYKHEIPGGQYSNLLAQVTEMGSKDEFEKIKELYRQANILLGNLIKVTPSSKVVGDLAIFMSKNGLTMDNILTEGAGLSYPDSVIDFFKGMIGQPEGGFPKELQKIVLKDIEPITVRPGTLLPDVDFEQIKQLLREKFDMEGFTAFDMEQKAVSHALYPKVYEDYCTHFDAYNDVTTLESHVYFFGLRKGEETVLKVDYGKDILIKFVHMSDPDDEGFRVLTFEVNGMLREQKVLDKTLEVVVDRKLKADKSNPAHLGSTIPGTVETVLVKEGDEVKINQPLMIVEAMKMETTFVSKVNGKVDKIYVAPGEHVNAEDLLVSFILDEE